MLDIEGDWVCRQGGTTCSFNFKARDGKKCVWGYRRGSRHSSLRAPLDFWREIITFIDRWNCPLKLEGKYKPKLEESTSAQRGSNWFLLHPLGWKKQFKVQWRVVETDLVLKPSDRAGSSHCCTYRFQFGAQSPICCIIQNRKASQLRFVHKNSPMGSL